MSKIEEMEKLVKYLALLQSRHIFKFKVTENGKKNGISQYEVVNLRAEIIRADNIIVFSDYMGALITRHPVAILTMLHTSSFEDIKYESENDKYIITINLDNGSQIIIESI